LGDGALGDDTGVDGQIVDPGGPAVVAVPTMPWWAMLALLVVLTTGAVWLLRRYRYARV
jgi:hypothetical protein